MKKQYLSAGMILLAGSLIFTACGTKETANKPSPTAAATKEAAAKETPGQATQTLLGTIKTNGKIRIGTEGTYAPFTYHDKDGKLTGFDVEIAQEIAKKMGVQAEFIETKWDGMFAGLDSKRFDIVVNEVSIKEDRKVKYDFSDPYIVSKAVLIVHKDNKDIKKITDLKGKKAGQSLTSNLTEIAKSNGAEIVQTDGFNQAIDLLLSKRIDATINDGLSYLDLKKQKPDVAIQVVDETKEASQSAVLINKGNQELVDAINIALADLKKDGTYLKISEKYFGQDVSK
ncbi:amino acid ABC transporter substrate-binding protein [Paenibacillus sp. Soil724D2]|uniref:amino acid ABC transporter substrate-binding protein n=1 Tax=Paenibacillus sp. (strain Soil724D2) TaxID=1736392 RepID=UPI000715881D|nr:amino acid ABC transporter substrate-binding protein [Paenibacillus sp. Soil724D2]KRE34148.1 amino acid ABC transporter substrate-binding protein [Paenibacillus sp. Soil724D2]